MCVFRLRVKDQDICRLTYDKVLSFIAYLDLLDVAEYIYHSSSFRINILEEIYAFKVEFPVSSPKSPKKDQIWVSGNFSEAYN